MDGGSLPDEISLVLTGILDEEREKLSGFISESHRSVASRIKQYLAGLHGAGSNGVVMPEKEILACSKSVDDGYSIMDVQPIFTTTLGSLPDSLAPFEEDLHLSTSQDEDVGIVSSNLVVVPSSMPKGIAQSPPADGTDWSPKNKPQFHDEDELLYFESSRSRTRGDSFDSNESAMKSSETTRQVKLVIREDVEAPKRMTRAKRVITNPLFESVFAGLIFFNAICMGLEQQYVGIDIAYRLQMPGSNSPAEDVWPYAETAFLFTENFFGLVFTGEVIMKLAIFRSEFFSSLWNLYDGVIIACWIVQSMSLFSILMVHPLVLRLARMGRLLRLLRFAKAFQVFDVLHLLVRSMAACMTALMWSALFLILVMMGTAILLMYLLQEECENESLPLETRLLIYSYFGTFTNGMFSMYELTMGNWVPISRTIVENVSEWYIIFFVIYRTLVGFAVLKVVTAIFNAETFRVTQSDDNIMLMHKERQIGIHSARMHQLLLEGDETQDGCLNIEEFKTLLTDKKVQKWLAAQEIELKDVELAFRMIDTNSDGRVNAEELVRGLARLKGAARSVDMVTIIHAFHRIEVLMDRIDGTLHGSQDQAVDMSISQILQNNVSPSFLQPGGKLEQRPV
eukprot:TRINITY_DN14806_c1_g2_i1.p1 TRINITY_DN14806_c1_g2~~TRINITY_DN14806_c1_g2_i1.p1  ORF type:complete len:624 (+),score=97.74 TRINITY_DN14806_c1_g2_i1:203-2074(+)